MKPLDSEIEGYGGNQGSEANMGSYAKEKNSRGPRRTRTGRIILEKATIIGSTLEKIVSIRDDTKFNRAQ